MSIGQLSDSLGFSDPTYFARWFKRLRANAQCVSAGSAA